MRALLVFVLAVAVSASLTNAADTYNVDAGGTAYIQLGDSVSGDLGAEGGTAFVNFNAFDGTKVTLRVTCRSLFPNLELLDPNGVSLDLGDNLILDGRKAEIRNFEVSMTGNFTFVITGVPPAGTPVRDGSFGGTTRGVYPPDVLTGELTGQVLNAWTGEPLPGVLIYMDPFVMATNDMGMYGGTIPFGNYTMDFEATNFETVTEDIVIFPLVHSELNVLMTPMAPVIVTPVVTGDPTPGGRMRAAAIVEIYDGSEILSYHWSQVYGAEATLNPVDAVGTSVVLAARNGYKDSFMEHLAEPPIGEDQLPDNVPPPDGEFPAGMQSRFEVLGASPFAIEEAALVTLEVEVVTTSGTYVADVEIHTALDWRPSSGLRNQAINVPIIMNAKEQASYDWTMVVPDNSTAELMDAGTRHAEFVPDWPGVYELTVTDLETAMPVTIQVYAGNWRGVIVGEDVDGRPVSDPSCTGCHNAVGLTQFPDWAQTGHAEIFTNNLNSSPYWGPQCFGCHTVGYDLGATNNGIDEQFDYQDFLASGLIGSQNPNAWSEMLVEFPATAQLANIQCENCHGPQWGLGGVNTLAHGPVNPEGEPRVSLSSDACATCHGEPLRHGRFQQWQLSAHANYELAIDESESGNCSRCHTANGFLTWLPVLLGDMPGDPLDSIEVTWTADESHPQTCATCHDPHNIGTTSGNNTNATVRISGNTPPLIAGFTAYGVGSGAICMTCHNTRRGLRNDDTFDDYYGTSEAARAPHGSAQADMLMGENAYLVQTGIRGAHSFVTDTCTKCHMVETPPPDDLSYNFGGTNHTFYAADDICSSCHGEGFDAEGIQTGIHETLDLLQGLVEDALFDLMAAQFDLGYTLDFDGELTLTDEAEIKELEFTEYRGRQAVIVTLQDDTVFGPYRMTDIDVLDLDMLVIGQLYDFADPALIKAGWNWSLVHNDGSFGIHNPTFSYLALQEAIQALDGIPFAGWPTWLNAPPVD